MNRKALSIVAATAICAMLTVTWARACPFCSATQPTFSEEIETADVALIVRLLGPVPSKKKGGLTAKSTFEVVSILKGGSLVDPKKKLTITYISDGSSPKQFFLTGVGRDKVRWSRPVALSQRGVEYVRKLPKLPPSGVARLKTIQEFLEDKDEVLAADAYDEFARADYESVIALKDHMHHDQLVEWIKDPKVLSSRRRLYLTMLGVCGTPNDVPWLEEMVVSSDPQVKLIMDALIACYLTLKGEDGVELIEKKFLMDPKSSYSYAYSAILAIRFHLQSTDAVPKPRLLQALRHVLNRTDLAHVVIADLARMEDWSVMDRMVKLFKDSDDDTWVRVPVINYMKVCPLPEAKKHLEQLAKLDPGAMRRANLFPAFVGRTSPKKTKPESKEKSEPAEKTNPDRGS